MLSAAVGWDIGGAHLKVARLDADGAVVEVVQLPCPLWRGIEYLRQALDAVQPRIAGVALHAVTMTGEMTDTFASRAQGVAAILCEMRARLPQATLRIYAGERGWLEATSLDPAASAQVASANWHASAQLVARLLEQAVLLDLGSTTADIAIVRDGVVRALGRSDAQRLALEELVYTGAVRTPVFALANRAPLDGEWLNVMAEVFATAADVYRLTGELPADADQLPSADGQGKTELDSARRLARMLGRDLESTDLSVWRRLAQWFAEAQLVRIQRAFARAASRGLVDDDAPIVGAGVGRFVLRKLAARVGRGYREFSSLVAVADADPEWISNCAPAVAVAWLARTR